MNIFRDSAMKEAAEISTVSPKLYTFPFGAGATIIASNALSNLRSTNISPPSYPFPSRVPELFLNTKAS